NAVDFPVLDVVNHPLETRPVKVRAAPSIVNILVYYGQSMLGGILPEHHALCLDAAAFTLKFIVTAQSQIKCGVINRRIVWLFHQKSSLKRNNPRLYNTRWYKYIISVG